METEPTLVQQPELQPTHKDSSEPEPEPQPAELPRSERQYLELCVETHRLITRNWRRKYYELAAENKRLKLTIDGGPGTDNNGGDHGAPREDRAQVDQIRDRSRQPERH